MLCLLAAASAVFAATTPQVGAKAPEAGAATVELDLGAPETDEAFLQASSKARFASALAANAHSRAMWRFGGNFQPQVSLAAPFPAVCHP